jgi:hypothetical protein
MPGPINIEFIDLNHLIVFFIKISFEEISNPGCTINSGEYDFIGIADSL